MSSLLYPTEEKYLLSSSHSFDEDQANAADNNEIFELNLDIDTLNMTSEEIDFDEIDDDLERFQEDEMVKQALHRGIDLKKYGQELATQLKEVKTNF